MKGSSNMVTSSININEKDNLIWAIADKLTGPYKPHEYGEVILPLTVMYARDPEGNIIEIQNWKK